jgi:hypothetical protein
MHAEAVYIGVDAYLGAVITHNPLRKVTSPEV